MSEAASRFTFFPVDERQALRMGRFLMAAGTSLLLCLALFVCAFLGLLPWQVALEGSAGIATLMVLFYLVFRTGLNLRFADPSLTTEQIGAAILFIAYIMHHASGAAREALTLFYPVALLFGVLRLNVVRLMALAILALLAHGTVLHLAYLRDPGMDAMAALTQFAVLLIVLPWFAVMGGYVSRLRERLSDSHRALKHAHDRITEIAVRDELTGVYNRRFLMESLGRELLRAERLGTLFSVCLIDIDRFKSINDSFGHAAGDEVLRRLSQVATGVLRGLDVFGRFGGEEFLLILPGAGLQGGRTAAERLRSAIEAATFEAVPGNQRITVTIGLAEVAKGEDVAALLARADRALYAGKSAGRNRVTIG